MVVGRHRAQTRKATGQVRGQSLQSNQPSYKYMKPTAPTTSTRGLPISHRFGLWNAMNSDTRYKYTAGLSLWNIMILYMGVTLHDVHSWYVSALHTQHKSKQFPYMITFTAAIWHTNLTPGLHCCKSKACHTQVTASWEMCWPAVIILDPPINRLVQLQGAYIFIFTEEKQLPYTSGTAYPGGNH